MKGVLSKFTKPISIERYFSSLPLYGTVESVDSLSGYFLRPELKDLLLQSNQYMDNRNKQLVLTDHAYERWNQRVAYSTEKTILENKLNILYAMLDRVDFITHEMGVIDKDILFTYEQEQGRIIISTFYGRLSQNPSLNHFETMRNYNHQSDDYIELSLVDSILSSLFDPPIPAQRMIFKGSTSQYLIDKYSDNERSLFVLLVLEGAEKGLLREIYSDRPECEKIEKSVRQAISLLGEEEFVYNHIAFHYPDELSKRLKKLKGK
ncbi:hypothetical protein EHV15_36030 [Paenibacillus oralis]|uniref:Uncharacterized protein n=1 Tax=Paenibacillus oralis TaxID=2490856 RepID=A0A3P3TAL0_9BACL|nr:hypothetical protein [Paenibacillus oralis]RRJ54980.1 hypothetical protein EHV15_36030 [Paenibacillus oralis]